jgi:predicted transcriptional regulator
MTNYDICMTMLSFRVDDSDAEAIQRWADELGVDRSALLRDAVRQHLNRLASEGDADRWEDLPLTDDESALATIADWGPAEDWEDWADATR